MEIKEPIEEPWWRGPLTYILGLFLILILLVWFIPARAVKIDPNPTYIPTIQEVAPAAIEVERNPAFIIQEDFPRYVKPSDPVIKQTADKIVTLACEGNKICHAKAIFYFVRDNFQYVSDPAGYEYIKSARESLASTGGDCDDASILAANLLGAVGIRTRFVFIPGHVYIQAYMPDALKRYKIEDKDWVSLDLTCTNCGFGELPYRTSTQRKIVN
ncbi:transglutaminase domain-containing protein [Candidatus Woesearchaeota archaeon]|nr:transglutaminase domain-containing protein [Candidatus Woesearchaeota archaeon]